MTTSPEIDSFSQPMNEIFFGYLIKHLNFWLPAGLSAAGLISLIYNRRLIIDRTGPASKKYFSFLLVIFLIGGWLRLFWTPHTHYVFDDELYHLEIAGNMQERRTWVIDHSDSVTDGRDEALPTWMPVFHFCLSLLFHISGPSDEAAFIFNAMIGSLTVLLFFMMGKALFERDGEATVLAAMLCFYPLHVKMSGGGNLEPLSLFFMTFSLTVLIIQQRSGPNAAAPGALALIITTLAVMTRIENVIIALVVFPAVIRQVWKHGSGLAKTLTGLGAGLLALICLYELAYSYISYSDWRQGVSGIYPLSAVKFLLTNPLNPLILPVLALAGAVVLWRQDKITVIFSVYGLLLYALACTVVQRVDISRVDSIRFNLSLSLFELVMAAGALGYLLKSATPKKMGRTAALAAIGLYLIGFFWSAEAIQRQIWPERAEEVEFVKQGGPGLPLNSLVCSEAAVYIRALTGLPSTRPEWLEGSDTGRYDHLFFYRSFSWKQGPENWESKLSEKYWLEPVLVKDIGRDRLGFFRMIPR